MINLSKEDKKLQEIANNTALHAVVMSKGKKTAGLSIIYGGINTCPISCPFKGAGCYGEGYRCSYHWNNSNLLARDLAVWVNTNKYSLTKYIRFNETGDLAIPGTDKINLEYVKLIIAAFKGRYVYTYTHCSVNDPENIKIVKYALKHNFTISFSCERVEDVQTAINAGCPAVLAVNTMSKKHVVINGINFLSCPSNTNKEQLCNKCRMCMHCFSLTGYVPVFALHGAAKDTNKAIEKGFLSDI